MLKSQLYRQISDLEPQIEDFKSKNVMSQSGRRDKKAQKIFKNSWKVNKNSVTTIKSTASKSLFKEMSHSFSKIHFSSGTEVWKFSFLLVWTLG